MKDSRNTAPMRAVNQEDADYQRQLNEEVMMFNQKLECFRTASDIIAKCKKPTEGEDSNKVKELGEYLYDFCKMKAFEDITI